ncbi:MAG: NFACT RNA binding domain-containing protein [Clostridia bacterium]|nr:NFACT RNA binding domain-containing protein [Clostridia bacterium]
MALDTLVIHQLVKELNEKLENARIEKIHQPEKDEILLIFKTYTDTYRLVISANAAQPRIHLTSSQKENPQKAPMFCMLLRKHLQSGRLISISQIDYERIIKIDIDSYDELGDLTRKHLFCEIMGRHSNIILTNADLKIIDSIKHVDFSVSSVRQILPGLTYSAPPTQNKIPILSNNITNCIFDFSKEGITPDKAIMNAVSGISPLIARETVSNAIEKNIDCSELTQDMKNRIADEVKNICNYPVKPCIITDKASGKVIDFSVFDIKQYSDAATITYYDNINTLLDAFYKDRDSFERMKQKSSDLVHLLNTNIERVSKKIAILKRTIDDAKNKDIYKIKGDLLTANLYNITQGEKNVVLDNYYDENLSKISIELNPSFTPSQNAQRYYKLYQKAKNAEIEAAKQFETAYDDLQYLESTLVLTQNAQSESDLNAIRNELSELGYMKRKSSVKKQKVQNSSKPHHYISSDGFDIYVGKNNTQNDYLTLRYANSQDIWFHTKKIHGSHTIIKLGINKNVPDSTIKEAAMLAAYYSKGRDSSNVPVDYTAIKNVRKPNGAKPGMVIYDYYNTIYVTPSAPKLEKIN